MGIVNKILQDILPIFFVVQFAFLYNSCKNSNIIDLKTRLGLLGFGALILFLSVGTKTGLAGLAVGL